MILRLNQKNSFLPMNLFTYIRNWSEVWAFLIPLIIIISQRGKIPVEENLVVKYVIIGLLLNSISTTMYVYHKEMPVFLKNNNIFYNLHSIARVCLFSWYVFQRKSLQNSKTIRILLLIYFCFILLLFTFFKSPFFLSTPLLMAETIVLLSLCTIFFYQAIMDDEQNLLGKPSFLICSGLFIFEAINFFIFLFYKPLGLKINLSFGKLTWTIHNFSLVFFCIVLAIALYKGSKNTTIEKYDK